MADKNLHDIKIDELDSSKKSSIKNILTLLALLFIILVISVVITRLILNTDSDIAIENNNSQTEESKDLNKSIDLSNTHISNTNSNNGTKNESTTSSTKTPVATANVLERNLTSAIKTPLSSHVPKKDTSKKDAKEIKTYSEPRKNSDAKKENSSKNSTHSAKDANGKKSSTVKHTASTTTHTPKKEYVDKVVTKKEPKHPKDTSATASTHSASSSSRSASYLGGKRKKVTHSYYIKVGTYRDPSIIVRKIKKSNFNYGIVKLDNNHELNRVLVGPFFSRNQAKAQLSKVRANILSGAYVTKVK